jgi:hypothetical protein
MIWVIAILATHWIADFLFQTRKMGLNKGKSIKWLNIHVATYTTVTTLIWWALLIVTWQEAIFVFAATFISHWVTDFLTSRASGYCYLRMMEQKGYKDDYIAHLGMSHYVDDRDSEKVMLEGKRDREEKEEHKWQYHFWSVIGFDQLIHVITLLMTVNYLTEIF